MTSAPGDTPRSTSDAPETSFEVELVRTRALERDFIGLSLAEAEQVATGLGVELRVIDSDTMALTADLRSRRITIDIRSGSVATATAG
ncbi:MAG: hypothetical protein ACR2N4_00065 [Jatrophihabitans sp.]